MEVSSEGHSIYDPADYGRVYYVYKGNSALPVTGPWRDEDSALQYAEDYACDVVLGIDVTYRRVLRRS